MKTKRKLHPWKDYCLIERTYMIPIARAAQVNPDAARAASAANLAIKRMINAAK